MPCIFETSSSNEEMRAAYLLCTFDYAIAITRMMVRSSELLICEVGCDIEEGQRFFH